MNKPLRDPGAGPGVAPPCRGIYAVVGIVLEKLSKCEGHHDDAPAKGLRWSG